MDALLSVDWRQEFIYFWICNGDQNSPCVFSQSSFTRTHTYASPKSRYKTRSSALTVGIFAFSPVRHSHSLLPLLYRMISPHMISGDRVKAEVDFNSKVIRFYVNGALAGEDAWQHTRAHPALSVDGGPCDLEVTFGWLSVTSLYQWHRSDVNLPVLTSDMRCNVITFVKQSPVSCTRNQTGVFSWLSTQRPPIWAIIHLITPTNLGLNGPIYTQGQNEENTVPEPSSTWRCLLCPVSI